MRRINRRFRLPLRMLAFLCLLVLAGLPSLSVNAQQPATDGRKERERGIDLYHHGNTKDAISTLREAVKLNKEDASAWYYLGLALTRDGKIKESSSAYEKAVKLLPGSADARTGLAYTLLLRNKLKDASREAERAVGLNPNIPDAHYIIGVISLREGDQQKALNEADTAIRLNSSFALGYLLKSQALVTFVGDVLVKENESFGVNGNRYGEAAAALGEFLKRTPNAEHKETWIEQLESLRVLSASYPKGDPKRVVSAKEVTTKPQILSKPAPSYTEDARRNQVTGTIVLRCVFTSDGTVKHFLVVKGLPDGLTEVAIKAARKIKFVPATINGRPVSMFMQLEYNFNLY